MSDPASLAEARARKADDAKLWSPRDMLEMLLRRITSGEIAPNRMIIHFTEPVPDEPAAMTSGFACAGVDVEQHIAMLRMAEHRLLTTWGG